ncbi:AAEL017109-PA [Aedes aegypti]|uniref:AAEL017109-PA n=1 Tax=Aedes aegypti TaxID=7159 RepID=J9HSV1_AEDAE|nr:AAEL017109-PA [Aedes aegypti]
MQGDGLVQPLPGLVQGVDAVSNTNTVATAVKGHSFQLADRSEMLNPRCLSGNNGR